MVGARRPSVTTALGQLIARGELERRADGGWVLRGSPPEPQHAPAPATGDLALDRISV
jgi:CRP/FNR family cyclic AMP-dependent transcriptional regulator